MYAVKLYIQRCCYFNLIHYIYSTARNCKEAGHTSCCTGTDCKVKISQDDSCYCDVGCYNSATYDCCKDIKEICPQPLGWLY